jgi:hypothetical protein
MFPRTGSFYIRNDIQVKKEYISPRCEKMASVVNQYNQETYMQKKILIFVLILETFSLYSSQPHLELKIVLT